MNKIDLYPGQRKRCRAVATISKGNGKVRINNIPVEVLRPEAVKELILTPLIVVGELRNRIDIAVHVEGGGVMGQAFASAVHQKMRQKKKRNNFCRRKEQPQNQRK